MKNTHTAETVSCTKPWGQIHAPLVFLALLLIGSVPQTALGQGLVINQPDAYVVVEPIAGERSQEDLTQVEQRSTIVTQLVGLGDR